MRIYVPRPGCKPNVVTVESGLLFVARHTLFYPLLFGSERPVRDAGSARQSGAKWTPHLHFGVGLSEIIHQHSSVSHVSHKLSWHVDGAESLHATAPPHASATRSGRPTHRHTTQCSMGGYRARSGIAPQTPRRTDRWGGGRIPHTPEQRRHLTRQRSLDVAGVLPSPIAFSTAPRRAGLGGRPRSSEPHAMRACAMAPLAPCLRQID